MDVSYSVCFSVALILSQKQKYYFLGDQLSPVIIRGFLRSEENVHLNDFQHFVGVGVPCNFYGYSGVSWPQQWQIL